MIQTRAAGVTAPEAPSDREDEPTVASEMGVWVPLKTTGGGLQQQQQDFISSGRILKFKKNLILINN